MSRQACAWAMVGSGFLSAAAATWSGSESVAIEVFAGTMAMFCAFAAITTMARDANGE